MYSFKQSVLAHKKGKYVDFKTFFNQQGYEVGGAWEYDHGYFDKQLLAEPRYVCVRIPLYVLEGVFGHQHARVETGVPFVLAHEYEAGIDEDAWSASALNQFAAPQNKDAPLTDHDIHIAREELSALEQSFSQYFQAQNTDS